MVAPLAALALIGASAAVATNPLLLSIAVLSSGRKRRDAQDSASSDGAMRNLTSEINQQYQEMQVLEKYISTVHINSFNINYSSVN